MKPERRRCVVYTRKSSEEGLDQEFNSLDAQREAGEAYVKSQSSEGWALLPGRYDDGGYSGGSMERPGLKVLLADIGAGLIDVVVVYKIDRLTRSLADFARIVELFDRHAVSFVSVTQAFNTTTSMGRLTLNVLLSFAQFEREVTGERIRDKIAASKAKGMWMGGTLPLGYDLPMDSGRALVVNEVEARTVRLIFETYLELGSVHALERWLAERDIRSKVRVTRSGKTLGGQPFSRGALFHLLRNRTYLGMIVHKEHLYPGAHSSIVDSDLFERVQRRLDAQARRHDSRREHVSRASLAGRLFDTDGNPMTPSFSHGAGGKVYRYYVSAPLQQGARIDSADGVLRRVPASGIEQLITETLAKLTPGSGGDPLNSLVRAEVHAASLELIVVGQQIARVRERVDDGMTVERDHDDPARLRISVSIRVQLRGGRTWVTRGEAPAVRRDPVLIKALRKANAMLMVDSDRRPILAASPASPYLRRLVRLAFLAPDLQRDILAGRQPTGLTLEQLIHSDLPACWEDQRRDLNWGAQAL